MDTDGSIVKVYRFKKWDVGAGDYIVSRRFAILEEIEMVGGVPIDGTETEIDRSNLNAEGMTVVFVP